MPSSPGSSNVGYTDHGNLNGLGDDDHTQYPYFTTGTGTPVGAVTPQRVGHIYVATDLENAWIATNTTNADWEQIDASGGAGPGGGPSVSTGSGAPVSPPSAEGDSYIDTTNDVSYMAVGTASSGDWKQTSNLPQGITSVSDDTTPQLGGPLNVNGQEITGAIDLHSTGDIIAELGDAAGANKLSIRDSGGVEVARINSDGSLRLAERKLQSVVKAGTSSSFFKVGFLVIPYDCTVTKIEFCSPNRTISADASNYWGLMVENATAGVDLLAAKYTTATNTITAGLPFDMGALHGTASNLNLSANDVLVLDGDVEAGSPPSWFASEVVIVLTVTEI